MRCTFQKHKYSAALRHMTETQEEDNLQFVSPKDNISPPISIINIETIKKPQVKKNKQFKRFNPLTTFNVPHTKNQSKIFKFVVQRNSLREQAKEWELKFSERVIKQNQKLNNQYSVRIYDDLKIVRRIEASKIEKLIQMNKKQSKNKNQLQILKKKSQENLIENIQSLRKREKILGCEQDQRILFDITVQKNRKSKTEGNYFQDSFSPQNVQIFNRIRKQQAMLRLKQNIKNKLSRRHMYHALKQKSEAFNKIKVKIRKIANKQDVGQASFSQSQDGSPLHYGSNKIQLKNFSSDFKGYTLPIFQRISDLKVQPRAFQFISDIAKGKLQSKNSNLLKNLKNIKIESKSLSLKKNKINNPQSFDTIKSQMRNKSRKQANNRERNKYSKDIISQKSSNEGLNMFRLLTPWHNDQTE